MKHDEWLEVGRKQVGLWPGQPWEPGTMSAAFDLFANVPLAPALQALSELAAEGREFAPAPGVVLSRSLQILVASTPALPDPDLTRDLTPAEKVRASRMAAGLNGRQAQVIVATWMEFAAHAKGCEACRPVAHRLRASGLQSHAIEREVGDVCAEGRPLFEAWRYAVDQLRVLAAPASGVQQEAAV